MTQRSHLLIGLALFPLLAAGCGPAPEPEVNMDTIAETFVKLALALGEHDADYVDAYLGPAEWREEVRSQGATLDEVRNEARQTLDRLRSIGPTAEDPVAALRYAHLEKSLSSLIARADLVAGIEMSFDEESRALYDAEAPHHDAAHFQEILDRLDALLPGEGPLVERYEAYREEFIIPTDRIDEVFDAAIVTCRERTMEHIDLPAEESFEIEYVTDKPWSGYNWYQGGYHSLIQVNTDLPIYIDRALDLACHEGYPGHHVYNLLVEKHLVGERGWMEFTVYPLFSPRSLIAEGTANFGIEVAFPPEDRLEFEGEILFSLAGLDAEGAEDYLRIQELTQKLSYAGNEAARRYLDGELDREAAIEWLATYSLMPRNRAEQRLRFIEKYRSYVINYNLGEDLVQRHIEARAHPAEDPAERWHALEELLSTPRLPSQLLTPAP